MSRRCWRKYRCEGAELACVKLFILPCQTTPDKKKKASLELNSSNSRNPSGREGCWSTMIDLSINGRTDPGRKEVSPMLSRLKSPRTHLLLLAFSLFTVSLVLGLSAYLTDTKTYNPSFRTATGQELGFEVTGKDYDKAVLVPGGTISLDAKAAVNGETPLYVFIDINTPAALRVLDLNSGWNPIEDGSTVYYYGRNGSLAPLGPGNPSVSILDQVSLSQDAGVSDSFYFTITGYAIQTTNLSASDPKAVYELIVPATNNPTDPESTTEGGTNP